MTSEHHLLWEHIFLIYYAYLDWCTLYLYNIQTLLGDIHLSPWPIKTWLLLIKEMRGADVVCLLKPQLHPLRLQVVSPFKNVFLRLQSTWLCYASVVHVFWSKLEQNFQ